MKNKDFAQTLKQKREYNTKFVKQKGCCAFCGKHVSKLTKPLVLQDFYADGTKALVCREDNEDYLDCLSEVKIVF
jgi:hypothetical protein